MLVMPQPLAQPMNCPEWMVLKAALRHRKVQPCCDSALLMAHTFSRVLAEAGDRSFLSSLAPGEGTCTRNCCWACSGCSRETRGESQVPTKERMERHPGGLAWGHSHLTGSGTGKAGTCPLCSDLSLPRASPNRVSAQLRALI